MLTRRAYCKNSSYEMSFALFNQTTEVSLTFLKCKDCSLGFEKTQQIMQWHFCLTDQPILNYFPISEIFSAFMRKWAFLCICAYAMLFFATRSCMCTVRPRGFDMVGVRNRQWRELGRTVMNIFTGWHRRLEVKAVCVERPLFETPDFHLFLAPLLLHSSLMWSRVKERRGRIKCLWSFVLSLVCVCVQATRETQPILILLTYWQAAL